MNIAQSILTHGGVYVDPINPDIRTIHISDIAHSLSQLCRFGGHTRLFYSVAQHCVLVSQLVPQKYRLHALLHDAAEAYYGDMVQPLKYLPLNGSYRDHQDMMQARIFEKFGLGMLPDDDCREAIHRADLVMLATERRDLMIPESTPWPVLHGIEARAMTISPMMPQQAESAFLQRYKALAGVL